MGVASNNAERACVVEKFANSELCLATENESAKVSSSRLKEIVVIRWGAIPSVEGLQPSVLWPAHAVLSRGARPTSGRAPSTCRG
jgi:hypothetical protein